MSFTSLVFPIFLLAVLTGYYCLRHRMQNYLLLAASYVFYGWWDWRFLSLLAISSIVDFYCGRHIAATKNTSARKRFLMLSLFVNLGFLGFFKYYDFFAGSMAEMLASMGFNANISTLNIILPVGISFYTFQTMAYTIDIYRDRETPAKNFWDFALYVSYFPQLVAGPIERSVHLLPQFAKPRKVKPDQIYSGCQLILMGYFKKMLIADSAAPLVKTVFENPGNYGSLELTLGVYLFALQIYGDFAGYTDIARGVSRLFGIDLCLNFRQPYLATNITEFWRRWHLSLSSWLRDYLYIPLGGNRKGTLKTYRNNMITMLLGGLWHGASWNFVIWGGLHGVFLSVHKFFSKGKKIQLSVYPTSHKTRLNWMLKSFITFNLVCLTWIFFRAQTTSGAFDYIGRIATEWTFISKAAYMRELLYTFLFLGGLSLTIDLNCWKRDSETPFRDDMAPWRKGLTYAAMILLIILIGANNAQPFIYFQF